MNQKWKLNSFFTKTKEIIVLQSNLEICDKRSFSHKSPFRHNVKTQKDGIRPRKIRMKRLVFKSVWFNLQTEISRKQKNLHIQFKEDSISSVWNSSKDRIQQNMEQLASSRNNETVSDKKCLSNYAIEIIENISRKEKGN